MGKIQLIGGPKAGANLGTISCDVGGVSDSASFTSYKLPSAQTTLPTITGKHIAGNTLTASTTGLTGITNYSWDEIDPGSATISSGASTTTLDTTGHDDKTIELVVTCDQGTLTSPAFNVYAGIGMDTTDNAGPFCTPHDDATCIATTNGDWLSSGTWLGGNIPKDGARVLVPYGVTVTYDEYVSNIRLDWLRIDGTFKVAQDQDTRLLVEHIIITRTGRWENGLGNARLPAQYRHRRTHSNRDYRTDDRVPTNMNKTRDPWLIGRGLANYGEWEEWGAKKDHFVLCENSNMPMTSGTTITLEATPAGWEVGDEIVIPWTRGTSATDRSERVSITNINGAIITFSPACSYDHDHGITGVTRTDLYVPIVNLTRNIFTQSENGANIPVYQRGHQASLHGRSATQVWGVQAFEMGRSERLDENKLGKLQTNVSEADEFYFTNGNSTQGTEAADATSNIIGRYSFHNHMTGFTNDDDTFSECVIDGNPGWGMTHHRGFFRMNNNVAFRVAGAHFVGESGNETGEWIGNVAVNSSQKAGNFLKGNDQADGSMGGSGYGFWQRGRATKTTFNYAVDCGYDYAYFHRETGETSIATVYDPSRASLDIKDFLPAHAYRNISLEDVPINHFAHNTSIGTWKQAIAVTKAGPNHRHGIWIVMKDHFAWSDGGAEGWTPEYISHYSLVDSTFIGYTEGIRPIGNTHAITVKDCVTEACSTGVVFGSTSVDAIPAALYDNTDNPRFSVVNHTYTNCSTDFLVATDPDSPPNDDPANDIRTEAGSVSFVEPSTDLPWTLGTYHDANTGGATYTAAVTTFDITDSLGTHTKPQTHQSYGLPGHATAAEVPLAYRLDDSGYWNIDGTNTLVIPMYVSDRTDGHKILRSLHGITLTGNSFTGHTNNGTRNTGANTISNTPVAFSTTEGTAQTIDVIALCSDTLGDTLSFAQTNVAGTDYPVFLSPNSGRFTFSGGELTYDPVPGFTGTDSGAIWIDDEHWNTHRIDVSITVT